MGSKEGWTPSTFVSSRANRKKDAPPIQQNAEDFMDEEDLADAEEAKRLQTSEAFTGLGSTEEDVSQRGAFMDIRKASGDTMGVKLLRRMGWRDGQGVGPKVLRKARLDDEGDSKATDEPGTYLFAPENSRMISFIRKNDQKGLGFEGESRLTEVFGVETNGSPTGMKPDYLRKMHGSDTLPISRKEKKKLSTRQGSFGVGVLNDTGSDDEDTYQMGPQISYNRMIGADKKKKKPENGKTVIGASNPLLRTKPIFISKKAASSKANAGFRRCCDGRLPLDGFILSTNEDPLSSTINQDNRFPPPIIPEDWKSSKTPSSTKATSTTYQSPAEVARTSMLNPSTRAKLLGETPLSGKSVFDYLSPSARSRIATLTNNPNLPPALNEAPPPGYTLNSSQRNADLASLVPNLDPSTAATALGRGTGGWIPYGEDPSKRARYRTFLEIRAGLNKQQGLPDRAEGMSTEDWVKEMTEFAHAAQIFKPMAGMMASRFTSSSASSSSTTLQQELNQRAASEISHPSGEQGNGSLLSTTAASKPLDPAEEAARLGMYGPLTRSTTQFFPTRLLCKRFNVKPPEHVQLDPGNVPPGDAAGGTTSSSSSTAVGRGNANPNDFSGQSRFQSGGYQTQPQAPSQSHKRLELVGGKVWEELRRESGVRSEVQGKAGGDGDGSQQVEKMTVVDPERNEALEKERPGDAVFRAIFGTDSEGDED